MADELNVDDQSWDKTGQFFKFDLSGKTDIVSTGQTHSFQVRLRVKVRDGSGTVHKLDAVQVSMKAAGPPDDATGRTPLLSMQVPWDRAGGTVSGNVKVIVRADLRLEMPEKEKDVINVQPGEGV